MLSFEARKGVSENEIFELISKQQKGTCLEKIWVKSFWEESIQFRGPKAERGLRDLWKSFSLRMIIREQVPTETPLLICSMNRQGEVSAFLLLYVEPEVSVNNLHQLAHILYCSGVYKMS